MQKHKLLLVVVMFLSLLSIGHSGNLKLIQTIEINQNLKDYFDKSYSTEFYNSKKKLLGKYYSLKLIEMIKLPDDADSNMVLVELETNTGQSILCSYPEISEEYAVIPPIFLLDKVTGSTGDTVKISENIEGEIDYTELDKELKIATVKRVYCQTSKITKSSEIVFKSGTVVFPMDICDRRWITDVVRLKIYLFEK